MRTYAVGLFVLLALPSPTAAEDANSSYVKGQEFGMVRWAARHCAIPMDQEFAFAVFMARQRDQDAFERGRNESTEVANRTDTEFGAEFFCALLYSGRRHVKDVGSQSHAATLPKRPTKRRRRKLRSTGH